MISKDTMVWTSSGWKRYDELYVGQKIKSYDPVTNTLVDDTILGIETGWIDKNFILVQAKGMRQVIDPDHEILLYHKIKKEHSRIIASKLFGRRDASNSIIYNRPYKLYCSIYDMKEVEWSARHIGSFHLSNTFRPDSKSIEIAKNLNGGEARAWLDSFFGWCVLLPNRNWAKTIFVKHYDIYKLVIDVAVNSGLGIRYGSYMRPGKTNKHWSLSLNFNDDLMYTMKTWGYNPYKDIAFDLITKNGSFEALRRKSNFISSCKKGD